MKRFISILTVVVLLLSLCTVASADSLPSSTADLTVHNVTADTDLDVFKVLDCNVTAYGTFQYVWTSTDYTTQFVEAIEATIGETWSTNPSISEILLKITNTTALQTAAFAKTLAQKVSDAIGSSATPFKDETNGVYADATNTITFSGLPLGYYLIRDTTSYSSYEASSVSVNLILFPLTANKDDIYLKSTYYTIPVKTEPIVDNTVKVGDYIPYTINVEVPNYTSNTTYAFSVVDTLGTGLTYVNDTGHPLTVTLTNGTTPATIGTYTATPAGQVLTIDFGNIAANTSALYNHIGDKVTITYYAQVTAGATNDNLTNDVYTYENTHKVVGNGTKLFTYGFNIDKDNEYGEALAGAKFKVYTTDGTTKTYLKFTQDSTSGIYIYDAQGTEEITTPTSGILNFWGLSAGTYYIEETVAPAGYNLLANPVVVTLSATVASDGNSATWTVKQGDTALQGNTINIINYTGVNLPSTGGSGTTLFIFGGMGLILAAGLFLALNRKRVFGK